jgi:NTP pyrophosphatase (non-canonical NTP hydrolase)
MINEHDIKDFENYQQKTSTFMLNSSKNPQYLFTGLAGETGEVCSLYAKMVRDGVEDFELFGDKLSKEIGDVLFFCSELATYYGMSLQEIAEGNIAKLKSRQERGVIGGQGDDR